MCNVFSHASLSLKSKALHSTKVHCRIKVATGDMFCCLAKCRETKSRGVYKVSCFVVLVVPESSNLAKD